MNPVHWLTGVLIECSAGQGAVHQIMKLGANALISVLPTVKSVRRRAITKRRPHLKSI